MAASGKREHKDIRSFLTGPEFRILVGAGAGYVARKLWNRRQDVLDSKLAQLNAVPTVPMSSIDTRKISEEGELVVIENGIVYPLSRVPEANYHNNERRIYSGGVETVVLKNVTYTNQPKEFKKVFEGVSCVDVYRVPYALVSKRFFGKYSFVIVKNADIDHLPLKHERTTTMPLDPPVKLTKKVTLDENKEGELTSTFEVCKVSKESVLQTGTRLDSVFGRLSMRNGMAEIEPCPNFPKKCFTMRRDEIRKMVSDEVNGDVYPSRTFGFGLGLVSLGLLLSGIYSLS